MKIKKEDGLSILRNLLTAQQLREGRNYPSWTLSTYKVSSMDEITTAIKSLKNGKSAGPDGMPAVVLKVDKATT